jgi:hypothetical protein
MHAVLNFDCLYSKCAIIRILNISCVASTTKTRIKILTSLLIIHLKRWTRSRLACSTFGKRKKTLGEYFYAFRKSRDTPRPWITQSCTENHSVFLYLCTAVQHLIAFISVKQSEIAYYLFALLYLIITEASR